MLLEISEILAAIPLVIRVNLKYNMTYPPQVDFFGYSDNHFSFECTPLLAQQNRRPCVKHASGIQLGEKGL